MSDSPTDWPFYMRLIDGSHFAFRLEASARGVDPARQITAVDIIRWLPSGPHAWFVCELADLDGKTWRGAIHVPAIAAIFDSPEPATKAGSRTETPAPESAPLVFDEEAFLGVDRAGQEMQASFAGSAA